jgi:PAS domain S-box-containing protein
LVKNNIDVKTLELLPVAIILFDNKQIYYLNKKAIDLFKIPQTQLKELHKLSVFSFIDKSVHKRLINNNKLILKDIEFPPIELQCYNLKKEVIYVEAKSNCVLFNNKKVIQSTFLEINDRIERYNQLEKTKEILNSISKSVKEIIYEFSFFPAPHINFISDSVFDMLGRKPSEIYKNPNIFLSQIHEEDRDKYVACLESYLRVSSKANNSKETFRFFHKNGKQLILEVAAKPKYKDKKIVSFIGVIRDITQEKNYQQELEQKWNNYKNLLDTSPIGIFIHEGICLYANKTAANILEINNPKTLVGKNLVNYIIPEQRERGIERIRLATSGKELSDLTYTVQTSKGKLIEVELKTVPFIYNGKPVVQTIISDISAEKKLSKEKLRAELAEESNKELKKEIEYRQKIQNELVTQTTKYEAIFNNTSHLIWTVNRDLRITSFNKNYY